MSEEFDCVCSKSFASQSRLNNHIAQASRCHPDEKHADPYDRRLTDRQLECLHLASLGYNQRRIGRKLHITKATVNSHLSTVCQKLHAADTANAVLVACYMGLIGPDALDQRFIEEYHRTRPGPRRRSRGGR